LAYCEAAAGGNGLGVNYLRNWLTQYAMIGTWNNNNLLKQRLCVNMDNIMAEKAAMHMHTPS